MTLRQHLEAILDRNAKFSIRPPDFTDAAAGLAILDSARKLATIERHRAVFDPDTAGETAREARSALTDGLYPDGRSW